MILKVILPVLLATSAPSPVPETVLPESVHPSERLILPSDEERITIKELQQRMAICLLYVTNQTDPEKIIKFYKLDTVRKRRDWELQCQLAAMGVDLGYQEGVATTEKKERNFL